MDKISPERRSRNMSRIRSKDTAPELAVRRFLHRAGLRYRLHRKDLPGKPDLVFASRRAVVFVHGCFWHGCPRCVDGTRKVQSNTGYWGPKIKGNRQRDLRRRAELEAAGWLVHTVWACEVDDAARLTSLAGAIKDPR